ncbi:hypothetical protein BCR32DRAFT_328691 [Anaeromyces robustus]|uniref:G-patch domain-containing protein n=1 Tax=Anaeromyces robustus TaxID=1754192 RepID=A0A1Y1WWV7_9FUNG|nr:hypothetical protein BCR32DRAFT_328691 [Anaeromyces robustus]|eukprot:ORX78017.1 hypothetical protein BCR32DRAFT_328691 [Anaeromyces robustus]
MKEAQMDVDDLGNDSITKSSIDAIPILKQNAVPGAENLMTETEKFRHDIKYRPEESTLEDYERIPIEEFGAAMLRGMGWEKGKGVGKNRNKNKNTMVSPIEFIPRPALLGLGAQPKPPDLEEMKKRRKRKMMGKEEIPKEYKPNITSDGKVRHFKTIDESINNNKNNNNNSINSRSHSHSRDHSHDRNRSHSRHHSSSHNNDHDHERERNHHRHSSHRSDKDKGGNESDSSLSSSSSSSSSLNKKESKSYTHSSSSSYTHNQKHNHDHRSHSRHHSHHDHDEDVNYNTKSKNNNNKSRKYNNNSWLYPNIRVRIVSKSFKSGKYYKKKGVIFDVNQQGECILRLDNGKLLENVKERYLETLIPEINEIIMVVKHTNNYTDEDYYQKLGKVLSKDRETEKAMIQLEPSMDVVLLSFDDICEYKGNTNDFY